MDPVNPPTGDARRSRILRAVLSVAVAATVLGLTGPLAGSAQAATSPCLRPSSSTYHSYKCKVYRLQRRHFVVVALVDTGVNPYHMDFRLPAKDDMQGVPPWEYISGYPRTAQPLNLSLGASSYSAAVTQDAAVWSSVKNNQLYYEPGTKIIGAYNPGADSRYVGILDNNGHGTGTASLAAGMIHGFDNNLDVLIVSIQGLGSESVAWAAAQPWIDVVSNSWGYLANGYFGTDEYKSTKAGVAAGQTWLFAAGNGISNTAVACDRAITVTSANSGPSWIVSVGAVSPVNGQDYCWHSIPPDVSSYGNHIMAADYHSMTGERNFNGTSCATPLTAGVMAAQLLQARTALNDVAEGPHGQAALAVAGPKPKVPSSGPLADRVLTHKELEVNTMRTAFPAQFDPNSCTGDIVECLNTFPTTPLSFVFEGYGIVNPTSRDLALDVLLGRKPSPDRSTEDAWKTLKDAAADAIWGHLP